MIWTSIRDNEIAKGCVGGGTMTTEQKECLNIPWNGQFIPPIKIYHSFLLHPPRKNPQKNSATMSLLIALCTQPGEKDYDQVNNIFIGASKSETFYARSTVKEREASDRFNEFEWCNSSPAAAIWVSFLTTSYKLQLDWRPECTRNYPSGHKVSGSWWFGSIGRCCCCCRASGASWP